MTNFERFKEQFEKDFGKNNYFSEELIYRFFDFIEEKPIPYNGRLEIDNSNYGYNSYGNEDSTIEKVFYFEDFDIYIMFKGTKCSYEGIEYETYKEVKPKTKTIQIFE